MLGGQCGSQGRVLGLDVVAEETLSVRSERREAAGTTDTGHVSRRVISRQRRHELKACTLNTSQHSRPCYISIFEIMHSSEMHACVCAYEYVYDHSPINHTGPVAHTCWS